MFYWPFPTENIFSWSTNNPLDTDTYLDYFLIPYFDAHDLSYPSFRYIYLLWIIFGIVFVTWSVLHVLFRGSGGSSLTAFLRKYTIRRYALINGSKKNTHKHAKWFTPTVAQMLTMLLILLASFCLSYIGPDYINPSTCTFGGECTAVGVTNGPPKSAYTRRSILKRRVSSWGTLHHLYPRAPQPQPLPVVVAPAGAAPVAPNLVPRAGVANATQRLNPSGWAPYNDPLLSGHNYDIQKSLWTASSRVGLIAYALLPLVVTVALRLWPFGIFSIPWLTNYGADKTAIFHRWFGRIVWMLSTVHVGLWIKQLYLDLDPYGNPIFLSSFQYYRFVGGWVVCRSSFYAWIKGLTELNCRLMAS